MQAAATNVTRPGLIHAQSLRSISSHPDGITERKRNAIDRLSYHRKRPKDARADDIIRLFDIALFILACISVLLMVVDLSFFWETNFGDTVETVGNVILRSLISCTTVLMLLALVGAHFGAALLKAINWEISLWNAWIHGSLPLKFTMEFVVLALHVPPLVDSYLPYVSGDMNLVVFLRMYTYLRVMRHTSPVYLQRRRVQLHMRSSAPKFGWHLSFRELFYFHNMSLMPVLSLFLWLSLAFSVHVVERVDNPDIWTVGNSLWFAAITMLTVGYGDIVPSTWIGRCFAVMIGLSGVLLASLLIAAVQRQVDPSISQLKAMQLARLFAAEKKLKQCAAKLIQINWRKWKARAKEEDSSDRGYNVKLRSAQKKFRSAQVRVRKLTQPSIQDFADLLGRLEEQIVKLNGAQLKEVAKSPVIDTRRDIAALVDETQSRWHSPTHSSLSDYQLRYMLSRHDG